MKRIVDSRQLASQNGRIQIIQDHSGYFVEYYENDESHVITDHYESEEHHEKKIQELCSLLNEN